MPKGYSFLFLSLFLLPHSSCLKQESVSIHDQFTITSDEWSGIYFKNEMEGYVVGGRNWYRGIAGRTTDGGQSWQVDSLFDKQILCLASGGGDFIAASGIELNLYELTPMAFFTNRKRHSGSFRIMRGLDIWDRDLIMGVHGNGVGSIERLSTRTDSTQTVLEIDRELNTMLCIDRTHWIAGGYGILLRTEDEGSSWDTLDVFGDQFLDCSMPSDDAIYILGSGGSVWRSVDSGRYFEKRRKGGIIGGGPPFKAICFKSRDEGLIGGEEGLLLRTENGGKDWIQLEGLPDFNIQDISFDGKKYWLCGSGGRILSLIL